MGTEPKKIQDLNAKEGQSYLCIKSKSDLFKEGRVYASTVDSGLLSESGSRIEHSTSTFVPVLDQSNADALHTLPPAVNPPNPKQRYGDMKPSIEFVPPTAFYETNNAFKDGAKKYGPFNWRETGVEAVTYYNAALRHLMSWFEGEDRASDSGALHLAHAIACLSILIDASNCDKLIDNRPLQGPLPEWLKANTKK